MITRIVELLLFALCVYGVFVALKDFWKSTRKVREEERSKMIHDIMDNYTCEIERRNGKLTLLDIIFGR